MRLSIRLSVVLTLLWIGFGSVAMAQPTPGVADYYVKWSLEADGEGEWVLENPGFWTDEVFGHLTVQVSGSARVDMDLSLADPFDVSGTWDSFQEDAFTYTCIGNPVTLATAHHLWTLSSAANLPRTDFSIVLETRPDGVVVVKDPFPAVPALPSGVSIQITASGADCNGPVETNQEINDPNVGFPIFSTPGNIPSANADDTYFSSNGPGDPPTLYLDPFGQVPVAFNWHVEITDITACGGVTTTFFRDADGDGYGITTDTIEACSAPPGYVAVYGDCDDEEEDVNPGVVEDCDNGIDDDCNGLIDAEDTQTFYPDADEDGYGDNDPEKAVQACEAPDGYVTNSMDCNDLLSSVHPGATEFCNEIDDDCDGVIDEGLPAFFFWRDSDGDGFGDPATFTLTCGPPVGYVANDLDCDDTSAANYPGAPEVCDGVDNDCDGAVDEGVCGGPMLTALSPAKVWIGLVRNEDAGIRFDLQAKVFLDNVEVGSGQLNSVAGGGRGFANALLHEIPLTLPTPVPVASGDKLKIRVLVRNACTGSTEVNGTARLWYNGQPIDSGSSRDAGSRFNATIAASSQDYFLRRNLVLRTVPGSSRESEDQATRGQCGPFRGFGTWKLTLP